MVTSTFWFQKKKKEIMKKLRLKIKLRCKLLDIMVIIENQVYKILITKRLSLGSSITRHTV